MNLDPCLSLCMKSKLQLYQGPKCEIGNTEITNRTNRQRLVRYRYVKEHSEQEPFLQELRPTTDKWDLMKLKGNVQSRNNQVNEKDAQRM